MLKNSGIILFVGLLSSCGGGGGDAAPVATAPANSSGFPSVAGRYSFNTGTFNFTCSDGSTGTNPALALNVDVTQNANALTLVSTSAGSSTPGLTVIDSTGTTGNVAADSSFILNQTTTANITGISGTVVLSYNQTGSFTSSGWSGTYTYSASSASFGSCTYVASYTGTKVTSKPSLARKEFNLNNDLPTDIYDQFSIIGSLLGTIN